MMERRLLQGAIALACLVPLVAGGAGMMQGLAFLHSDGDANLDSHFRYLSGLLFGIGIAFAMSIPHIERHTARVQLLTGIVFVGGLARLYAAIVVVVPDASMHGALVMELVVTPLLCLWQRRVARLCFAKNSRDIVGR